MLDSILFSEVAKLQKNLLHISNSTLLTHRHLFFIVVVMVVFCCISRMIGGVTDITGLHVSNWSSSLDSELAVHN